MRMTLGVLGRRVGAKVSPDVSARTVDGLAVPANAGPTHLTFMLPRGARFDELRNTRAAAVMCDAQAGLKQFVVDDVLLACARLCAWLPPVADCSDQNACADLIDENVEIHPSATIGSGARIGSGSRVGAQTYIESGAVIGNHCDIGANVVIRAPASVGERCYIGSGCNLGEDGFGFIRDGHRWVRLPNFGDVRIGDDARILAHSVIHRGVFSTTQVGRRCVIDSHVLIGHDARIGDDTAIAGHSAVAGAAVVGKECKIGGKVGIADGVYVADGITVTGMSMVARSLDVPNSRYSSGWPAELSNHWWRRVAGFKRLLGGQ